MKSTDLSPVASKWADACQKTNKHYLDVAFCIQSGFDAATAELRSELAQVTKERDALKETLRSYDREEGENQRITEEFSLIVKKRNARIAELEAALKSLTRSAWDEGYTRRDMERDDGVPFAVEREWKASATLAAVEKAISGAPAPQQESEVKTCSPVQQTQSVTASEPTPTRQESACSAEGASNAADVGPNPTSAAAIRNWHGRRVTERVIYAVSAMSVAALRAKLTEAEAVIEQQRQELNEAAKKLARFGDLEAQLNNYKDQWKRHYQRAIADLEIAQQDWYHRHLNEEADDLREELQSERERVNPLVEAIKRASPFLKQFSAVQTALAAYEKGAQG